MAVLKDILSNLDDSEEPLSKRIKLADNAFKSSVPIQHKEAGLIKWAVDNVNTADGSIWRLLEQWLSSGQFNNLVQNDINNNDIAHIIESFLQKLQEVKPEDFELKRIIKKSVILLVNHRLFKQHFKYDLKLYTKFISLVSEKIDCLPLFIEFIQSPSLFPRAFLLDQKFSKYFLENICPVLIKYIVKYDSVFDDVARVVQKCIFQGNQHKFVLFFDNCFEGKEVAQGAPHYIFKYLSTVYSQNPELLNLNFRLLFDSFAQSYNDFVLHYKFILCSLYFLNFNLSSDFHISDIKSVVSIPLSTSLEIFLTLLDILSAKSFTECAVSNIQFTDFLKKVLKSLMIMEIPTSTVYQICLKCISINPLCIEPLVNQMVKFLMLSNNENQVEIYEKVVIAIFGVFSKLHRIENFIAKMIQALKGSLIEDANVQEEKTKLYKFNGDNDIKVPEVVCVNSKEMFTEDILQCLTNCINGLASWQVINLMKTFLYHLNSAVTGYVEPDFNNDRPHLVFIEVLSILICQLLKSVRMADHTIPQNVVNKFVNGMDELKDILKKFGPALLTREHNHITMQAFLSMAYSYGEVYMTLTYYSMNNEIKLTTTLDNTYTASNLMYLHAYLDIPQWQLISQRITNFGEYPCKRFLQKLFVQKLRAMLLFENDLNEDILKNIVNRLQYTLEDTWKELLLDKFAVNFIVPKMDVNSLSFLAAQLIENKHIHNLHHIKDCMALMNPVIYTIISKINKNTKVKRKLDQDSNIKLSSRIFSVIPKELFFNESNNSFITEAVDIIKKHPEDQNSNSINIGKKAEKIENYLNILRDVPIIFSNVDIQKITFLYLYCLHKDVGSCSKNIKMVCESLIIGLLQGNKFLITDLFDLESLCDHLLQHFENYNLFFSLIVDNVFKNEESVKKFDACVSCLIKNLGSPKYLNSSFVVLQAINKVKKSKMEQITKEAANTYKEKIFSKMYKLACKSDYLIEAYGTCLKHYLSVEKDHEALKKLTDKLSAYIDYSLKNINNDNKKGCFILFATVLHNKQKLNDVTDDLVLKIWNSCKNTDIGQENSQLINLIVTLIPNEEFNVLVKDLFEVMEKSVSEKNYIQISRQLKIWKSILTCNVNAVKMKILQEKLEYLLQNLLNTFKNDKPDLGLLKDIVHLQETIIVTTHFILSPLLIDLILITGTILMKFQNENTELLFNLSISILERLLKHRNALIMDRLPPFLQQFRLLLKLLCQKSNSDEVEASLDMKKASDCAHKLEKLIKSLVLCRKDMSRISVFLIADILDRYEQINLFPNVKLHLNNCVYSLISLCDHHAVSYLMRVLSGASTEMFKILYEHYKKYYMFTGKV